MRTNTLLVSAGIASFVIFAIAFIPANVITDRLADRIRIGGVEGTLWNGHARLLDINGWQLRETNWNIHPLALLLGRLSARIATQIAGGEVSANASVSVFGTIEIHDLKAAGPITPIAGKLQLPVQGGYYQVQIDKLKVTDAWPTSVVGSAHITEVPLNIMGGGTGPTGNYVVTFNTESVADDGSLSGILSDSGGPIEVDGNLVLTPPVNYALQAKLKARPGAPAQITQALMLVGPVGQDGSREVSLTGSL